LRAPSYPRDDPVPADDGTAGTVGCAQELAARFSAYQIFRVQAGGFAPWAIQRAAVVELVLLIHAVILPGPAHPQAIRVGGGCGEAHVRQNAIPA
jgi:hypothetical protein